MFSEQNDQFWPKIINLSKTWNYQNFVKVGSFANNLFLVGKLKIYFYVFEMYVYFQPFFVVFYGESICGIETSCDYGFWRTLQSSKVLNTVFTTSVLVVIFLHSLSISSLEICLSLARPATQKLTRVTITRGLYQPEPSKFLNFQKNKNLKKNDKKSSSRDKIFREKNTFSIWDDL